MRPSARHRARTQPWLAVVAAIVLGGCNPPEKPLPDSRPSAAPEAAAVPTEPVRRTQPSRDLSIDESMGGHTLDRHIGKTDRELTDRLRKEPQISSASTYSDRTTAEQVVGAALASGDRRLEAWLQRRGRRPNLVLSYDQRRGPPIGRSISRGQRESTPCVRALVVLRWDEPRGRFYVLTSYPEADR